MSDADGSNATDPNKSAPNPDASEDTPRSAGNISAANVPDADVDPCSEEGLRRQIAELQKGIQAQKGSGVSGDGVAQSRLKELEENVTTLEQERKSLEEQVDRLSSVSDEGQAGLQATQQTAEIEHGALAQEVRQIRAAVQRESQAIQELEPQINEVTQLITNQTRIHDTLLAENQSLQDQLNESSSLRNRSVTPVRPELTYNAFTPPLSPWTIRERNEPLYMPSQGSFPDIPNFQAFQDAFARDMAGTVDNNQRRAYARFVQNNGVGLDYPQNNPGAIPLTDARVAYQDSLCPNPLEQVPWAIPSDLQNARQVGVHIHNMGPEAQSAYLAQYVQRTDQGPSSPLNMSVPIREGFTPPGQPPQRQAPQQCASPDNWTNAADIINADAAAFNAFGNQSLGSGGSGGGAFANLSNAGIFPNCSFNGGFGANVSGASGGGGGFGATFNASPGSKFGASFNSSPGSKFGASFNGSPGNGFGTSFNIGPGPGGSCNNTGSSAAGNSANQSDNFSDDSVLGMAQRLAKAGELSPIKSNLGSESGGAASLGDPNNFTPNSYNQSDNFSDDSVQGMAQRMAKAGELSPIKSNLGSESGGAASLGDPNNFTPNSYNQSDNFSDDSVLGMAQRMAKAGELSPNNSSLGSNSGGSASLGDPNNFTPNCYANPVDPASNTPPKLPSGTAGPKVSTPTAAFAQANGLNASGYSVGNPCSLTPNPAVVNSFPPSAPNTRPPVGFCTPPPPGVCGVQPGPGDSFVNMVDQMIQSGDLPNYSFDSDMLNGTPSFDIPAAFALVDRENLTPCPVPYQAPTPSPPRPKPRQQPQYYADGRRMPMWVNNPAVQNFVPGPPPSPGQIARERAETVAWFNAQTNGEWDVWQQPPAPPSPAPSDNLSCADNFVECVGDESWYRAMHNLENNDGPCPVWKPMTGLEQYVQARQQIEDDYRDFETGAQVYRPLDHVRFEYEVRAIYDREVERHMEMRAQLEQVPPEQRDQMWRLEWAVYGEPPAPFIQSRRYRGIPFAPRPPPRPATPPRFRLPFGPRPRSEIFPLIDPNVNVDEYLANNPLTLSPDACGLSSISMPNMYSSSESPGSPYRSPDLIQFSPPNTMQFHQSNNSGPSNQGVRPIPFQGFQTPDRAFQNSSIRTTPPVSPGIMQESPLFLGSFNSSLKSPIAASSPNPQAVSSNNTPDGVDAGGQPPVAASSPNEYDAGVDLEAPAAGSGGAAASASAASSAPKAPTPTAGPPQNSSPTTCAAPPRVFRPVLPASFILSGAPGAMACGAKRATPPPNALQRLEAEASRPLFQMPPSSMSCQAPGVGNFQPNVPAFGPGPQANGYSGSPIIAGAQGYNSAYSSPAPDYTPEWDVSGTPDPDYSFGMLTPPLQRPYPQFMQSPIPRQPGYGTFGEYSAGGQGGGLYGPLMPTGQPRQFQNVRLTPPPPPAQQQACNAQVKDPEDKRCCVMQ